MENKCAYKKVKTNNLPITLGYVAYWKGDDVDTVMVEKSLEALISKNSETPFPFLNKNRLKETSGVGVRKDEILHSPIYVPEGTIINPVQKFMNYMRDNGGYGKFGIPRDRTIIITNRNVLVKLFQLGRQKELPYTLSLEWKKHVFKGIPHLNIRNDNTYRASWQSNENQIPFGSRFDNFLVKNDQLSTGDKCTLYSINLLVLKSVCFIYGCEIDAIDVNTNDGSYHLTEIKTDYDKKSTLRAFELYENQNMNYELNRISERYYGHMLQGELGKVSNFIYGFVKGKLVKTQTFYSKKWRLLQYDLFHLRSFALLALKAECNSSWGRWEITKCVSKSNNNKIKVRRKENIQL